jgi:hypothetical protein
MMEMVMGTNELAESALAEQLQSYQFRAAGGGAIFCFGADICCRGADRPLAANMPYGGCRSGILSHPTTTYVTHSF